MHTFISYMYIVCYAPLNGQVNCGSGFLSMGLEGDNCTFSCDPGYMLQGSVTSGTCENTGNWSEGLPSCVPLNCIKDNLRVPANAIVLQLPSCDVTYQSQCIVSCDEGFTGDNVTYLCNVTSDLTMVDWMIINSTEMNHMCQRGLLCAKFWLIPPVMHPLYNSSRRWGLESPSVTVNTSKYSNITVTAC